MRDACRTELRWGAAWPGSRGTADVTTWVYGAATGLLTSKVAADGSHVDYAYYAEGKLRTRTWARTGSVVATYSYDSNTGDLLGVSYSDSTPAHRRGRGRK